MSRELVLKFFAAQAILDTMDRLPKLESPALDLIYPEATRKAHPLPILSYKDLTLMSGNIPLVKRGSQSYKMADGSSMASIEPQPVNPSVPLDAVDINNLRMLQQNGGNSQAIIDDRIDGLRRICRDTTQALAIQSLNGSLDYDLRGPDGAMLKYTLDYGTPGTYDFPVKIGAEGSTLGKLIKDLSGMKAVMQKKGFGNNVIFLAPADVYAAIIDLLPTNTMPPIDAEGNLVLGASIKVKLFDYTYYDWKAKVAKGLTAKTLYAYDQSAGQKLVYAAVDDIDANFIAAPFWAKAVKTDDPSGYNIIGQSKPIPVPNVKGIVKAVVLA